MDKEKEPNPYKVQEDPVEFWSSVWHELVKAYYDGTLEDESDFHPIDNQELKDNNIII